MPETRPADSGGNLAREDIAFRATDDPPREPDRKLSLLLRQSLLAVIEWGPDCRAREWSPAAESLFGYTRAEAIGRRRDDLIVPPGTAAATGAAPPRLPAQAGGSVDLRENMTRDGRRIVCEWTDIPLTDERGAAAGVISFAREVTERERAAEALRRSAAYNRSMLEASLDPLVTIEPDGTISAVNAATESATGRTRDALIGTDFSECFTDPEKARAGYRQALRDGSVRDYPLLLRRRDGTTIPVLYDASVCRGEDGSVVGVFASARDVAERKKTEAALSAKVEELARSNAELEEFAYVASHDLQEPLRMIASFTQLLSQRYGGTLDHDANEFLGYVVDGARRMQQMINDLLAYSRAGTRGGNFEPTDCGLALEKALENLWTAIEESGAAVTSDPLPTIRADPGLLAQVFQNLVANAIKFRGDRRPEIHVGASEASGEWVFSVRDNGIGIDPKHFDRIFDLFQRLPNTKRCSGSGIGLAICRKIVERHGGRMWVESKPGEGSVFRFSIPSHGRDTA